MTPDGVVRDWQSVWNSHDLDRIMAHNAKVVVVWSRKAVPLTGDRIVAVDTLRFGPDGCVIEASACQRLEA